MSIELCVLGSGSSGNSSLLRLGDRAMLIDAGFGPRAILKRLDGTGVGLQQIRAIMVTHFDRDHFQPSWFNAMLKHGIYLYCHEMHLTQLMGIRNGESDVNAQTLQDHGLLHTFTDRCFRLKCSNSGDGVAVVQPVILAHDREGVCGFRIEHQDIHLGYATDLGHVPHHLIDCMLDLDMLAIESNYDPVMQQTSGRHPRLIQRVMGGAGHLSNEQTFEAVNTIIEHSEKPLRKLVLLHLSRQCNQPAIVQHLFKQLSIPQENITISNQFTRTEWQAVKPRMKPLVGEQLSIFKSAVSS